MKQKKNLLTEYYFKIGLIPQIIIGLMCGILLALYNKDSAMNMALIGNVFINALKSVAPILVLVLVISSIANHQPGKKSNLKTLVLLYFVGMMSAAVFATVASFAFPSYISIVDEAAKVGLNPPSGVKEVLKTLFEKMIDNPVNALINANYIGLIVWGIGIGLALRHARDSTKVMMDDLSLAISFIVKIIIRFAPIGIFGLVAATIAEAGLDELINYAHLISVLVGCMLVVAFVINPLLAFLVMRENPYPLVFMSLKHSAIPAFFTRSSAANIPVNMQLCERLKMDKDTYSVAVPLGAAINMSGAAVTITILTLATVMSLNIEIDIYSAVLLCIITSVCACGASGIAGGSLLLIPVACSMFGIPNEISVKVIAIGLTIGVIQDSIETAVNSFSDVVFIGAISKSMQKKQQAAKLKN